jgi:hypothetical protein
MKKIIAIAIILLSILYSLYISEVANQFNRTPKISKKTYYFYDAYFYRYKIVKFIA